MPRLAVLAALLTVASLAGAEDRLSAAAAGPASAAPLPETLAPDKNVVWKADIPGRGWSSPLIVGDRVFVTSVVSDGKLAEQRQGLYIQDLNGVVPPGEHRWLIHCLDWKTGKTLWTHGGCQRVFPLGRSRSRTATPRKARYRRRAGICLFRQRRPVLLRPQRQGGLVAEVAGRQDAMGLGTAASPALAGDRLILVNDNEEKSFITALDKGTGKTLWEVDRDEKSNWATPFIWKNEQLIEIVTAGTNKVRLDDLEGKLLWELKGMSVISIPTPFAVHGLLYVASGYILDPSTSRLTPSVPASAGDISLKAGETSNKWIVWSLPQAGPYHPTPLVHGDYLYVLLDRGFLSCYDAKTGKLIYEKQRLGSGTGFTALPWAAGDRIYCMSEDGDTTVIKAGPKFEVIATNSLGEMSMATPALSGGSMVIRTQTKLYRIGTSAGSSFPGSEPGNDCRLRSNSMQGRVAAMVIAMEQRVPDSSRLVDCRSAELPRCALWAARGLHGSFLPCRSLRLRPPQRHRLQQIVHQRVQQGHRQHFVAAAHLQPVQAPIGAWALTHSAVAARSRSIVFAASVPMGDATPLPQDRPSSSAGTGRCPWPSASLRP